MVLTTFWVTQTRRLSTRPLFSGGPQKDLSLLQSLFHPPALFSVLYYCCDNASSSPTEESRNCLQSNLMDSSLSTGQSLFESLPVLPTAHSRHKLKSPTTDLGLTSTVNGEYSGLGTFAHVLFHSHDGHPLFKYYLLFTVKPKLFKASPMETLGPQKLIPVQI